MSVVVDISLPVVEVPVSPAQEASFWPLSVERYHEMIRKGILTENDPVELWEGLLVRKMPKSRIYCATTELVARALVRVLPDGWHVESQESITLFGSEFEPDVAVVRGGGRDYLDRNPGGDDLGLVTEVSESTLRDDRGFKKWMYARAAVPVYWIVNLPDRQLEVYSDPTGPAEKPDYRNRQDVGMADQVPLVIEGREVARLSVRELLP
jgi:Uma2 family endonuclease